MRHVLTITFKSILGGILGALIFLGTGAIKGLFDLLVDFIKSVGEIAVSFEPSLLMLIPISVLSGASRAISFGGDIVLLSALVGSELAFLKNFSKAIFSQFPMERARQIYRAGILVLTLMAISCSLIKIQRLIEVEYTYSSFCASVREKDYLSAYEYLSPEYRSQTNLEQFIDNKLQAYSLYAEACNSQGRSSALVSSFWNSASLFPYQFTFTDSWANPFLSGSELVMKNINGKWYFTGEGYSYY